MSAMCRVLKVSKSGFYALRDRAPSARARADALLLEKIIRIHRDSRERPMVLRGSTSSCEDAWREMRQETSGEADARGRAVRVRWA